MTLKSRLGDERWAAHVGVPLTSPCPVWFHAVPSAFTMVHVSYLSGRKRSPAGSSAMLPSAPPRAEGGRGMPCSAASATAAATAEGVMLPAAAPAAQPRSRTASYAAYARRFESAPVADRFASMRAVTSFAGSVHDTAVRLVSTTGSGPALR